MRRGLALGATAFVLVWSSEMQAQQVSARAFVDSTSYHVGDPIHVSVELTHPHGVAFTPLFVDTIGAFHLLERGVLQPKDETSTGAKLIVASYDSGVSVLPPLGFSYILPGDTVRRTVETNPLLFSIRLVEVDTAQPIKDLKPPLAVSWTLAEVATFVGAALAILGAFYLLYRYWRKRKQKKAGVMDAPPPRPVHLIALEQLAMLKEKKLWQQGLIKQYYSELTEILRRYFENRYGITALEQTTDEIVQDIQQYLNTDPVGTDIERILCRADLVKFARFMPTVPEHEESLTAAFDIIDRTRFRELISVSSGKTTNEEYVRT